MVDIGSMIADLEAESAEVDRLVADLPAEGWAAMTPATGWTVAHQIAHLAWTDHAALLAITDPPAFYRNLEQAAEDPESYVDRGAEEYLDEPAALLAKWRAGRAELAAALAGVPAGEKVAWYGTTMSPVSMVTARIMETWAHGLDVAQTVGVERTATDRLRHIVHLGHRTIGWAFAAHDRAMPDEPIRLELTAPAGGDVWAFGPADATNRITGPALDFCLLVTQRAHRSDLALVATGPVADEFLDIAQAFAGPPGGKRAASDVA